MTFFNKKTEVMKVELTPHGRYLLSIGKLIPHHYRFFDEGIVYHNYSGSSTLEHQSKAHDRILEETPSIKTNPNITGVETNYNNYQSVNALIDNTRFITKDDTINKLVRPLGTVRSAITNTTAFEVKSYDSPITKALKFFNSDSSADVNIPQIDITIAYTASVVNTGVENQFDMNIEYQGDVFVNGECWNIKPQIPIIEILEKNGMDEKENFYVSVFKVFDPSSDTNDVEYTKMKLESQTGEIRNDILLDQEEIFLNQILSPIDTDRVNYYFKMTYDYAITDKEFCRQIGEIPVKNIYLDKEIKCPDISLPTQQNQYTPYNNYISPEDLEDCD